MVVRIRLARFGRKHAPFYNIVVAQARTARNSKPMEVIGTYDPIPKIPLDGDGRKYKDIQLDQARAKYWLGVGAQPSDPAWRLLAMAGLLEPKYRVGMDTPLEPSALAGLPDPQDLADIKLPIVRQKQRQAAKRAAEKKAVEGAPLGFEGEALAVADEVARDETREA